MDSKQTQTNANKRKIKRLKKNSTPNPKTNTKTNQTKGQRSSITQNKTEWNEQELTVFDEKTISSLVCQIRSSCRLNTGSQTLFSNMIEDHLSLSSPSEACAYQDRLSIYSLLTQSGA
eukprot:m.118937 g.118937  ORF g.118937 m.118937 type:complete len:118 (-) comp13668_c0_seq10:202-555(-)